MTNRENIEAWGLGIAGAMYGLVKGLGSVVVYHLSDRPPQPLTGAQITIYEGGDREPGNAA